MPATEITRHCQPDHCVADLEGDTKEAVIGELIDRFVTSGALGEEEAGELYGEVLAREEEGTTGIGKGVAMPHSRASKVVEDTLIAVGLHRGGVEFHATDGAPVHVVFLIASYDPAAYLRIAGRIASVARDDVEMRALRRQTTPRSIYKFLEESWTTTAG